MRPCDDQANMRKQVWVNMRVEWGINSIGSLAWRLGHDLERPAA